jgi:hypothetical protein
MSNELNDRLRAALRPIDPGEDFTRKVLAQIASQARSPALAAPFARPTRAPDFRWLSAAALLMLVAIGMVVMHGWQARRAQEGMEARRQVMEALQVTSEKLDVAYRVVKEKEHSGA